MFMSAAVFATVITLGGAAAASAVEGVDSPAPSPSASATGYQPTQPHAATLAGSRVSSTCVNNSPWIDYSVTLVDPDATATTHTAYLDLTDGANSTTLTLGQVASNGTLSGRILWPGASVENGVATGWPGWALQDGEWVATTGNYAWTRGAIHANLRVNPELAVALSFPSAVAGCMSAPGVESTGVTTGNGGNGGTSAGISGNGTAVVAAERGGAAAAPTGTLPVTGGDMGWLLWPALGGALVLGGGVVLATRASRAKPRQR